MKNLIRSEFLKFRTTPSIRWMSLAAVGVSLIVVIATLTLSDVKTPQQISSLLSFAGLGGLVVLLLGVAGAAGEYRHRTITTTFLVTPKREKVVISQFISYMLLGLLIGLCSVILVMLTSWVWLASKDVALQLSLSELIRIFGGSLIYIVFSAGIGVGLGILLKNQIAAVVFVFIFLLAIDLHLSVLSPDFGKYLPTAVGTALSGRNAAAGGPIKSILPFWGAAATWALYAVIPTVLSFFAVKRRDI